MISTGSSASWVLADWKPNGVDQSPREQRPEPLPALTHHGTLSKSFNQPELHFSHL